jgi:hypothetical protein
MLSVAAPWRHPCLPAAPHLPPVHQRTQDRVRPTLPPLFLCNILLRHFIKHVHNALEAAAIYATVEGDVTLPNPEPDP